MSVSTNRARPRKATPSPDSARSVPIWQCGAQQSPARMTRFGTDASPDPPGRMTKARASPDRLLLTSRPPCLCFVRSVNLRLFVDRPCGSMVCHGRLPHCLTSSWLCLEACRESVRHRAPNDSLRRSFGRIVQSCSMRSQFRPSPGTRLCLPTRVLPSARM